MIRSQFSLNNLINARVLCLRIELLKLLQVFREFNVEQCNEQTNRPSGLLTVILVLTVRLVEFDLELV